MPTAIDPKYSIGIDEMDAQHARWLELIDRFHAAAKDHLGDDRGLAAARKALDALLDYTDSHFRSEEAFLAAHGYPGLAEHRAQHRELRRHVEALREELRQHRGSTPVKLNLLATIWLMEHIHQHDKEYARYLKKRGPV